MSRKDGEPRNSVLRTKLQLELWGCAIVVLSSFVGLQWALASNSAMGSKYLRETFLVRPRRIHRTILDVGDLSVVQKKVA